MDFGAVLFKKMKQWPAFVGEDANVSALRAEGQGAGQAFGGFSVSRGGVEGISAQNQGFDDRCNPFAAFGFSKQGG